MLMAPNAATVLERSRATAGLASGGSFGSPARLAEELEILPFGLRHGHIPTRRAARPTDAHHHRRLLASMPLDDAPLLTLVLDMPSEQVLDLHASSPKRDVPRQGNGRSGQSAADRTLGSVTLSARGVTALPPQVAAPGNVDQRPSTRLAAATQPVLLAGLDSSASTRQVTRSSRASDAGALSRPRRPDADQFRGLLAAPPSASRMPVTCHEQLRSRCTKKVRGRHELVPFGRAPQLAGGLPQSDV